MTLTTDVVLAVGRSLAASILIKVTITLGVALCGARLARNSRAAVRHLWVAAAFAVILVLPPASIVAPSVRVEVPIAAQVGVVPAPPGAVAEVSSASVSADAGAIITPAMSTSRWPSLPALLAASWIAGAAICLLPVAAGMWRIRSIRRSGVPWRHGRSLTDRLAVDAGVRRPVAVLLNECLPGPMTCGVVRPVIVLPVDARTWPDDDLHRAIVHELEHVRRADWSSQCLARIVCGLYWFHPLVWIARRQLSLDAERACDDAVLRRAEATAYADQLVGLAERLSSSARSPLLAMANRADLATRIVAVLDTRQRRGRAGASSIAFAVAAAALLVVTMSPLEIVAGASTSVQATVDTPRFEIVSIKPCEGEPPRPPGQRSSQGGFPNSSPGRFFIECGTVERLISTAYVQNGDPLTNQAARIGDVEWLKGVPGWVRSEKFTIEAKAAGTPDTKVMLGPMLRALLEDRFRLQIHRAADEAAMYVMTVAKGGLKIQPIGKDGCTPLDPDNPPGRGSFGVTDQKPVCGVMSMANGNGLSRWAIGGTTLEHFAGTLSGFMDRHVIDKTGIAGEFNVRLEFARDEHVPGPDKRPGAGPPVAPVDVSPSDGPTIFMALERQLGLKLDSTKAPHGFLVIDRVERPSANSGPGILQTAAPTAGTAGKFEVVSIKPCEPGNTGIVAGGRSGGAGALSASPGRLFVQCMTLVEIVARAYVQYGDPPPLNHPKWDPGLIIGGPAWAQSDRYTIEAKADGTPVQTAMMGVMLRALLEARFQLKLHQDLREVPAFALTVAAGGIKLKPVDPASCTAPDPNNPGGPRTLGADGLVRAVGSEKPLCTGGVGRHGPDLTYHVTGQSLDRVARTLGALVLDRPVVDKTGIAGQFSFHVEFANEENLLMPPGAPAEPSDVPAGPSIFTVFEKQLGLKLVPSKAQQGFLVIDRVERPLLDSRPAVLVQNVP